MQESEISYMNKNKFFALKFTIQQITAENQSSPKPPNAGMRVSGVFAPRLKKSEDSTWRKKWRG